MAGRARVVNGVLGQIAGKAATGRLCVWLVNGSSSGSREDGGVTRRNARLLADGMVDRTPREAA